MQQLGNIITPKKLTPPNVTTVEKASADTATNVGQNIAEALIAFHKTKPFAIEKSENTFFQKKNKNSTYTSLEEAITICRKAVDFNLTFTQNINFEDKEYFVSTIILHSSGETLSDRTPIKCKDLNDPHKFYGSVSYARRYSLLSSFSIPTADNDGVSAMGWDQPDDDGEPPNDPIVEAIKNAQSINELNQIYKSNQPLTDKNLEIIKAKRGELEK
jgi:hypothetical protein